ncbi:MAG TPA: sulfatase [Thermoanaerobaculia bacterium]|nr:sulfatase [Thermoanaerobaculia bacterium]
MRFARCGLLVLCLAACQPAAEAPVVRLVDLFEPERLAAATASPVPARTEWRFDQNGHAAPLGGWQGVGEVEGLAIAGGRLRGRSAGPLPLLAAERSSGLDQDDVLHAVELRMRVSAGANLTVHFEAGEEIDPQRARGAMGLFPFAKSPLVPGDDAVTYTLTSPFPLPAAATRHVLVSPTDAPGAEFEIESVRLIFRREHLASFPSGVSWQGLGEIYRETLVARAPESIDYDVELTGHPRLDLALGTPGDRPVTFVVELDGDGDGSGQSLVRRTLTTANRWEPVQVDLSAHAGRRAKLRLRLEAEEPGALGFWGSPAVRAVGTSPRRDDAVAGLAGGADPPQGVLLVMVDTLRSDHLPSWGYHRATAPALTAMAEAGVRFADAQVQATWTKVSSPSILTGLHPPTHGVAEFADRLPASAVTLAEVFRDAGYATLSFSSVLFTGRFTNLHQGFEELHEATSASDQLAAKTARIYVDRLLPWLERHRDDPFFVFLHLFDPHDPYEPHPPWDTSWFDPAVRAEHEAEMEAVRARISDPLMRAFLMPTRTELEGAGLDADRFVSRQIDWYDGSIRGFDAELARLLERLRELGLERKTLVVFVSDHGEEFLDHGRSFHGQSVYGELTNVPVVVSWPGTVEPGVYPDTVQAIDLMPTILEIAELAPPAGIQGRSFAPWLLGGRDQPIAPPPAFSQMAAISEGGGNPPPFGQAAYSVIDEGWKLVHNAVGDGSKPQFELFDHHEDPLNQSNVAGDHPEVVARLARQLSAWLEESRAARLPGDAEGQTAMSQEELERLRSLGYIQ